MNVKRKGEQTNRNCSHQTIVSQQFLYRVLVEQAGLVGKFSKPKFVPFILTFPSSWGLLKKQCWILWLVFVDSVCFLMTETSVILCLLLICIMDMGPGGISLCFALEGVPWILEYICLPFSPLTSPWPPLLPAHALTPHPSISYFLKLRWFKHHINNIKIIS